MSKIGPKETALKTLRPRGHAVIGDLVGTLGKAARESLVDSKKKNGALAPHHKAMVADGLPAALVRTGPAPKIKKSDKSAGVTLAPPLAVQKAIAADLKDEEGTVLAAIANDIKPNPKPADRPAKKETVVSKTAKKAKAEPAPKKVAAKKADKPKKKSKADIVEEMLCAKSGASQEELKKETGWPYTNVKLAAKRAGKKLVEKADRFYLV